MSYYFTLAFKYIKFNKARTMYSVLGITLTFVLCFCMLTMGYSAWDYSFYADYMANPYELSCILRGDDNEAVVYTPKMINELKRLSEDEAVEEIRISLFKTGSLVLPGQLKTGESYVFKIKLKDTGNLQKSAERLGSRYGFELRVMTAAAMYYGQGDSEDSALVSFLIMLGASLIGGFSVVILRNTMMIAVTERGRDFGLLRCVGMSDGQHRVLLFTEGIIMSLIASVLGMVFGFWLLKLIEPWLIKSLGLASFFSFKFYPVAALYTAALCVGVTVFSMLEPARLCAQVSPLEALHGAVAKELTLGRAIMLLAGKITGGRKKRRRSRISLSERLFGAPGFYAHRNLLRGKGKGVATFIAMLFSMFLLLTVTSFADTYTDTVRGLIRDMHTDYTEYLYMMKDNERMLSYDEELCDKLRAGLMKNDKVRDCFWLSTVVNSLKNDSGYSFDENLKTYYDNGEIDMVYELGCVREDMEKERPFLIDGDIDYDRMLAEGGVLLCDVSPGDETERRKTDYEIGDVIEVLSFAGAEKARGVYSSAIAAVSERHGMNAWPESYGKIAYFEGGKKHIRDRENGETSVCLSTMIKKGVDDETFIPLQEEVLAELENAGYGCREYLKENSVRMTDVLYALRHLMYERGERDEQKIFGILKREICTGVRMELKRDDGTFKDSYIRLVMPMEILNDRIEKIAAAAGYSGKTFNIDRDLDYLSVLSFDIPGALEIAVDRDMEILDENLKAFGNANGLWYYNLYEIGGVDYFDTINMLNVYKVIGTLLSSFILAICMTQILNTLQADMRIRRKELWLYDMVGMEPAQRIKMMLIEHGFGAISSCFVGALISFVFCYIILGRILNVDEDLSFSWPVIPAVLVTAAILGIILLVNLYEVRRIYIKSSNL